MLSAWLGGACGGRAVLDGVAGDGNAGGESGSRSAGAGAGGVSVAGGAGAGGSLTGTGGCAGCTAVCDPQACPGIACQVGFQPETLPSACCPTCEPVPSPACMAALSNYQQNREALLEKYQMGCQVDSDCMVVLPYNRCEQACQFEAVRSAVAPSFQLNLSAVAMMDCSSVCPLQAAQPGCNGPPAAFCSAGSCYTPKPH